MSPRSEEFMQQARDRLADAEAILFSQVFVAPGEFDQRLSALARRAKDAREEGDYEAAPASSEEAAEFVKGTAEFIAGIERLLKS